MNESVFRKKSIDKISSPESLNSYMRVTNPPVWMAIAAIIILLAGAIIWGVFGKIETKANAVTVCDGTTAVCYVSENDISYISDSTEITVDDNAYEITNISTVPVEAQSVLSEYAMHLADYQNGEFVYAVTLNASLGEGNYRTVIVTESISAMSFLWN